MFIEIASINLCISNQMKLSLRTHSLSLTHAVIFAYSLEQLYNEHTFEAPTHKNILYSCLFTDIYREYSEIWETWCMKSPLINGSMLFILQNALCKLL